MEEHHHHHPLSPLAVTHLLQHTLRSLCIHENSQWIYAVFWRILPRNYPPPKWEGHGAYDRSRGNRRNWILVWEDGFCNFGASTSAGHDQMNGSDCGAAGPSVYGGNSSSCDHQSLQQYNGLQPELFFKMSHEIYNYGEGLIGKVAADHSHKWIHKEPNDQEINFLSAWHNSADSHPRTWEAQFQSGIKTIALIAVREGVVQLGGMQKVVEDLSYVVLLRKKFSYIESIPGVLLPHPSSPPFPYKNPNIDHPQQAGYASYGPTPDHPHHHHHHHHACHFQPGTSPLAPPHHPTTHEFMYDHQPHHQYLNNSNNQVVALKNITPSMSSLEALLSKLPSVVPTNHDHHHSSSQFVLSHGPLDFLAATTDHHHKAAVAAAAAAAAEEEITTTTVDHDQNDNEEYRPSDQNNSGGGGETSTSVSVYGRQQQQFHHHHI